MHKLPLLAFLVLPCAASFAQGKTYSPHPSFDTIEGHGRGLYFGGLPNGRYQLADGSLRNSALVMRSISFRPDYRSHTSTTGMGRAWSAVQLSMSETIMASMSSSLSSNVMSTPTRVFSGSVNWPTLSGWPKSEPAPLGPKFGFSTAWVYGGKKDVLADFTFHGGTLANNAAWTPLAFPSSYVLDAYATDTLMYGRRRFLGPYMSQGGCADSGTEGRHGLWGGYTAVNLQNHGPNFFHPQLRNRMRVSYDARFVGRNTTLVTALGFKAIPGGAALFGVSCQRLHVDLSVPVLYFYDRTLSAGNYGYIKSRYLTGPSTLSPVIPALINLPVVVQSAWMDTVDNSLKITAASISALPRLPLWEKPSEVPRRAVYEYSWQSRTRRTQPYGWSYMNPVACYN